jgi:hypothetical protein
MPNWVKRQQNRSAVNPLFTVNPETNQQICGAFRAHQKQAFIEAGLTAEELMLPENKELRKRMLCHRFPTANGRCPFHGKNKGGRVTVGKYSKYLNPLSAEELTELNQRGIHDNLSEELALLSHFIREKLPTAMNETSSMANKRLLKLINDLEAAISTLNLTKAADIMQNIRDLCKESYTAEAAKKDIADLVKRYSDVFNIELKRRAVDSEYLHKHAVLVGYRALFTIVGKYVKDDYERTKIQKEFAAIINGGNAASLPTRSDDDSFDSGLEDQDEGSPTDYVEAEFSADDLLSG